MDEGLDAPGEAPAPAASRSRSPLGLVLFALVFALGGGIATLALTAALSFLGLGSALALGFFLAIGIPLFLALRVSGALKRRGTPALARHLLAALLGLLTHAALLGITLDWVGRSVGDIFLVADALVSRTVGEVPLLSGILRRGAEEATVSLDGQPLDATEGGPSEGDGGPEGEREEPEVASLPTDGGPAASASAPAVLSPRTKAERPVAGVVSLLRTDRGGYGAIVTTLDAGGATSSRVLDLTPFAADGGPVAADAARDGSAAFVMGGGNVVYAGPEEAPRALPALARGAKLPSKAGAKETRSLRAVRDLAIAPGGALLLVADLVVTEGSAGDGPARVRRALLGYHPRSPSPVRVLRAAGDPIPHAAPGSASTSYALRRSGPAGRVAVVEGFLEGGDGAANDWRLLAGRIDEAALLEEVARTGDAVIGLPERAVGAFEEASVLADGRVLFGAGFLEEGVGSSLFLGRPGAEPVALAAEAVREQRAPWPTTTPSAPHLIAEPDGGFAFTRPGAGVVLAEVSRPLEATLLSPGVRVYQRNREGGESARGRAEELFRPTLAQGGDWLFVGARLDDGRQALLLLSREDIRRGVAEALLLEGQALPKASKADPKSGDLGSIRTLTLYQWRGTPSDGTSP